MKKEIPSSVLEQAKKLCAISDDPTASTYEIEQALKVAHDILVPYGLTVEDILESLRSDLVEEVYLVRGRQRRAKWLNDLMSRIAWYTDSSFMYRTGFTVEYIFVGLLSQVQRAIFHAETLHDQVEYYSECRAPRNMRDIRVYKQGIVDRVRETMRDLKLNRVSMDVVRPMVSTIQSVMPEGRLMVLAPVKVSQIAEHREKFWGAVIDHQTYTMDALDALDALPKAKAGRTIDMIMDMMVRRDGMEGRLASDLRAAFDLSDKVYVLNRDSDQRLPFHVQKRESPRPPKEALQELKNMIQSYIDDNATVTRPPLLRPYAAVSDNPDYNIGYQHGAEIKIRDGIGSKWRR